MSILDSLRRLVDPVEHRKQEAEKRRKREAIPPEVNPDEVDVKLPEARAAAEPSPLSCSVCGHEGKGAFCPVCLAETMKPRK